MTSVFDDHAHPEVLTDLTDLQARLRGEPATLVPPGGAAHAAGDPVSRIEVLRRRLASLELEIATYEAALDAVHRSPARDAVVLPFRRPAAPADED